jgi:excinuclease ABC subunit B
VSRRSFRPFQVVSDLRPAGDQPQAISLLVEGLVQGRRDQVLLGVTGSGKTFTMAKVIEEVQRPALVLAHNKTLAGQLYTEFRGLFPGNAVEYFISYYDYYQPEAYVPATDTYIAKDASINDTIDRMRHGATAALLQRRDVIIVASVSCIYGLGSPEFYDGFRLEIARGAELDRDRLLRRLVQMQYSRNDISPRRATFRVRGDVVEIHPADQDDRVVRVEFFGDEVEAIDVVDIVTGQVLESAERVVLFPSSHYVTPEDQLRAAVGTIYVELEERLAELRGRGRLLEAQRLEMRTRLDLELLQEIGHCAGIENYSRHLDGRGPGEPPATLLDYFEEDFVLFVDESHISLPQVGGMFRGDRSRKEVLVEHGFRLPSALDNRPLTFEEFDARIRQAIHVSATPAPFELGRAGGITVEQVIRPTGLLDPEVVVRPARGQVDDLVGEIRTVAGRGWRVLVTALTKRMAEDLTAHLRDLGIQARYLHADVETLERAAILRELRLGRFEVLVGINLLREGLDLPEVALVAVLDADKEGFLRSRSSLIQTIGRAARNVEGRVILYADVETASVKEAVAETRRRREIQARHNMEHGIVPATVQKAVPGVLEGPFAQADAEDAAAALDAPAGAPADEATIAGWRDEMYRAAAEQRYEDAAELRDRIAAAEARLLR